MAQYSPEEVGFLDEMSKDVCSVGRHYGRSRRNTCAQKKQAFVCGQHTSTEALLTLDSIVAGTVVEGSMTQELFLEYLKFNVVSFSSDTFSTVPDSTLISSQSAQHILAPLSVLVMDNACIHHGDEILELADQFGKKSEKI